MDSLSNNATEAGLQPVQDHVHRPVRSKETQQMVLIMISHVQ